MKEDSPNKMKMIVEHLNISSLRNKFEVLQYINRRLDIVLLPEMSWICQLTWNDLNLSIWINSQFAQPCLSLKTEWNPWKLFAKKPNL